ncbi:MAG: PAS domain S-box protein, partial [Candidatus Microthrix parvicella]
MFGGECVDGILPGEKGDLYDLYPETAFSESMVRGTRLLRNILLGVSVLIFLVVSWLVIVVLRSTLYRIRDGEGTFRAAFHQAAVGMLRMKTDSRILEANETIGHILGRAPERLAGMRWIDLVHEEDRSLVEADEGEQIDWSKRTEPSEHRFLREDGSTRWLRWTVSRIDGHVRGKERVFALVEDVSEARRLSDEMKYQAS